MFQIVTANRLNIRPVVGDPTFKVAITPSYDTYYNSPQGWAVRQVGRYGANVPGGPVHGPWDVSAGKNVRIAILDSGVDRYHPDIAPNLGLNLSEPRGVLAVVSIHQPGMHPKHRSSWDMRLRFTCACLL